MTLDEINRTLRTIIRTELSLPSNTVRPANKIQPTTGDPFVTVLLSEVNSEGFDDNHVDNSAALTVTETGTGLRRILSSIQFFRSDAVFLAEKLRGRFQLNSAREQFAKNGFGFISCSNVKDLSTIQNTFWEQRAQLELSFYVVAKETAVIATYGEFPYTITTETSNVQGVIFEP